MSQTERAFYEYTQIEAQLTNALEHAPRLPFTELSREAQRLYEEWQRLQQDGPENGDGYMPDWDMADVN